MWGLSRTYYLFLGFHGFFLWLFPFFLPVYLYKTSTPLSGIALFVALSGIGFISTLWVWDRMRKRLFRWMIIVSLLLELLLVFLVYFKAGLVIVALINGGYNCFYWTIQRILFFSEVSSDNSGRNFGNFQIFVLVVLKAGIFIGSVMLGNFGLIAICFLSLIVSIVAALIFWLWSARFFEIPVLLQKLQPVEIVEIISFKDRYCSRLIFSIDGVLLYLESYFWLISLFLLVGESFVKLGLLVISLALFLGILFFLIKNKIDRLQGRKIYKGAVFLYALSWIMRSAISAEMAYFQQVCMILLIAFCTSFFRLAFNKRFFDLAGISIGYKYIFLKSYYSQFFLTCIFLSLAVILRQFSESTELLPPVYWGAAGLTFLYLKYRVVERNTG